MKLVRNTEIMFPVNGFPLVSHISYFLTPQKTALTCLPYEPFHLPSSTLFTALEGEPPPADSQQGEPDRHYSTCSQHPQYHNTPFLTAAEGSHPAPSYPLRHSQYIHSMRKQRPAQSLSPISREPLLPPQALTQGRGINTLT